MHRPLFLLLGLLWAVHIPQAVSLLCFGSVLSIGEKSEFRGCCLLGVLLPLSLLSGSCSKSLYVADEK